MPRIGIIGVEPSGFVTRGTGNCRAESCEDARRMEGDRYRVHWLALVTVTRELLISR